MRLLSVLVLASLLLAGCDHKSDDASGGDGPYSGFEEFDLDADAQRGVIRGVVVDASVLPIRGATVSIQGEDRSVQTNADGAFGFGNLTAGTYFLRVEKAGFFAQTPRADVVAGDPEPDVVKVVMERDVVNAPYVNVHQWTGFVQCSLSGAPVCRPLQAVGAGNDQTLVVHDLDAGPQWVQSEISWVPTQEVTDELWLWHAPGSGDEPGFGVLADRFGDVQGSSPLVLVTNEATAADAGQQEAFASLGVEQELVVMVFGGSAPETRILCDTGYCGGVGLTVEQDFNVFTHAFHRFQPPEGWMFSRDGTPTP